MPRIVIQEPGGIMPRYDRELLPPNAAQVAENVDLTGRTLAPIAVAGSLVALHDGTYQLSGIPSSEWFTIAKPDPPTGLGFARFFDYTKVSVKALMFYAATDETTHTYVPTTWLNATLTRTKVAWTAGGIRLTFSVPTGAGLSSGVACTKDFDPGKWWSIKGPIYRFALDTGTVVYAPETAVMDSQTLPGDAIPLLDSDSVQYGTWKVVDCNTPIFNQELHVPLVNDVTGAAGVAVTVTIPTWSVTFEMDLGYTINTTRYYYYVQTKLQGTDLIDEGPVSELTGKVIVQPGTAPMFTVVNPGNLYRSETGGDDFLLVKKSNLPAVDGVVPSTATVTDTLVQPINTKWPESGNRPDGATAYGSVVHPDRWAAIFYQNVLYPSDLERFYAFPPLWAITFPTTILALAMHQTSILVFTAADGSTPGKVFMVSGGHPSQLNVMEVTNVAPLLNPLSLCRLDQGTYWVSDDGLVSLHVGGQTSKVTRVTTAAFYTRKEWASVTPAYLTAAVADGTIFLTPQSGHSGVKLRVHVGPALTAVTTYTATSGVALTYRTRLEIAGEPWAPKAYRVWATAFPVTLRIFNDAGQVGSDITVSSDVGGLLPRYAPGRKWAVEVSSSTATIERVVVGSTMDEVRRG